MAKQKTTTDVPVSEDEDHAQINEALRRRVHELEDFQQRVEADAAKTIEIAEELVIARDQAKTALKQSQEYQQTIQKLALYDPLTGVANRNEFNRRFEDAIRVSKRDDSVIAVMLFDLDHFKEINDSYGHLVGDALLKFVAEHMMDATRETDTVARLGGDEFAIILTGLDEEERATGVAERVIGILSQPITLDGCMLNTGTSIGISLYPRDGEDSEELLRTGDKALYKAKSRGRGGFQFFNKDMDKKARAAHILENEMRVAIVRDEFVLHYQPQLVGRRDKTVGVEALARWQHPTRGLLLPCDFIDVAEANGLIIDIGRLILNSACRQAKTWEAQGLDAFRNAVNVSPLQFKDAGFVKVVQSALDESGLNPNRLELEITESLMMERIEAVAEKLQQLHGLGINVAVDDFGTGYSSLAYLKHLPIQKLKFDKMFVDNLTDDPNDLAIAEAIISLGHSLGLNVVAEGVETDRQADALLKKGCDGFQGYLFSKPLPADELAGWLLASIKESEQVDA